MRTKREHLHCTQRGFTLVEIMVVIIIISILVAMSLVAYGRMRGNAIRAECRSNQRGVLQSAYVYSMDFDIPDGQMNVNDLFTAGYLIADLCDCPSSGVPDMDDYVITWDDGRPVEVDCDEGGADHEWEPN